MKNSKRINLKGLREILSDQDLKNTLGGSGAGGWCIDPYTPFSCSCDDGYSFTVCSKSGKKEDAVEGAEDVCWARGSGQSATCD